MPGAGSTHFSFVAIPALLSRLPLTADCRSSTKATDARVVGKAGPPEHNDGVPAPRGMKMAFEGSVWSGPNVWFIRDRGLLWENADG